MTVRRTILIEPYAVVGPLVNPVSWCAREYVQHGDESRTRTTLFTAPTRDEVADWYAQYLRQYLRERREP